MLTRAVVIWLIIMAEIILICSLRPDLVVDNGCVITMLYTMLMFAISVLGSIIYEAIASLFK